MSKKKIVKLAVIRSNNAQPCPFGLTIPYACQTVGELIHKMAPADMLGADSSDQEKSEIAEANNHLLRWQAPGQQCPYTGKLFPEKDVVECNWNSNVAGIHEKGALRGSPFFYRYFNGTGLDGLYSYPLGWYSSVEQFRGPYSLESTADKKDKK